MPKYKRGQRVKVAEDASDIHTDTNGCEAIVEHTYKQAYGGSKRQDKSYCLFILVEPGTKLTDWDGEVHTDRKGYSVSWFEEEHLTLIEKNTEPGLEIIKEEYGPIKDTYRLEIYPVFHCPECNRLSAPRAFCLWCTPDPEEIMEDWEFIGEDPIAADAGGHGD